jgi:RNA polymerase sigma-70 factor (ECF subfamily)
MESMTPSDVELLQQITAGDELAFTTVYRRHQARIYRFALLMSGSAAIAEDVTQEVFIVLIREAGRYDASRGSLSGFLYGIARNHVFRCLERDRPYIPIADDSDGQSIAPLPELIAQCDPLDDLARNEMIKSVRQAVLALPTRYRDVVVLCDFQELSYAEAAQVLGRPVGTVSSRLHRGHALLLEKLRSSGKIGSETHGPRSVRCFA